jgi:hypothetical protein
VLFGDEADVFAAAGYRGADTQAMQRGPLGMRPRRAVSEFFPRRKPSSRKGLFFRDGTNIAHSETIGSQIGEMR